MKARYFTKKQEEAILRCAKAGAESQIKQAVARTEAILYLSMHNAGLSSRTINKVIAEKKKIYEGAGEYKKDGVMDFALQSHLDELGINFKLGFDEN